MEVPDRVPAKEEMKLPQKLAAQANPTHETSTIACCIGQPNKWDFPHSLLQQEGLCGWLAANQAQAKPPPNLSNTNIWSNLSTTNRCYRDATNL